MATRFCFALALLVSTLACSGESVSPTAPTATRTAPTRIEALVANAAADRSGVALERALSYVFDGSGSGPMVITFPPRNEPLEFRNALETKYRDGLRRPAVQTFVDSEGTIVWTQEYLRYRVNFCSHADAVSRVMNQIDGQGSRLREYTLFAEIISINRDLGLPTISNDGQYLKVYPLTDIKRLTGSSRDDAENLFTARMLLILESEALLHDERYANHLLDVLSHYYRDNAGKKSFRPLFLLNDLLRYWRTLCLNYEETRHDSTRAWRKKNVNLKFSRMMTVFGTVLPLIVKRPATAAELFAMCRSTPLERFAGALDLLDDPSLQSQWSEILDSYESFLGWKEVEDAEIALKGDAMKDQVQSHSQRLSSFVYAAVNHASIPSEYRRYLVV